MADLQKFIDELRSKVSIVEVVGDKVKLTRKGREYTGLCPFHNEKTPSFTVNEAKGFYHCFGCGAHGDIVKFEMEANHLPFMDALNKLSSKAGVAMPSFSSENKEHTEKRKSYYDIMELAAKYFEKNLHLTAGKEAQTYLYNRGLDDEIIAKFRLGYAPGNNGLKALLISKGIAETDIIELGLASISDNTSRRVFDFFRDRVIIPIMDKQGRVIAFGGRILGEGQPKYLNSPETPVFNKRLTLYNLHNAREKGYESKELIVCEGYMDVIALDKYGFSNAVAPLGTALTEDQIMAAWRVCPEPTLCFDGDSAGIRAATRSADRVLPILKAGNSLKFAFLPDKMDPDDFLRARGRDEFLKILKDTKPLADIIWKKNVDGVDINTPEQKALFEKNVLADVAKIGDESVRNYYYREMKNRVFAEFTNKNTADGQRQSYKKETKPKINRPGIDNRSLHFVVSAVIYMPELLSEYEEKLLMFDIRDSRIKEFINKIIEIYIENNDIKHSELLARLKAGGFEKELNSLLEIQMLKQQNPYIVKLRKDIDSTILEAQVKHIDAEMRECQRIIDKSEDFPDDVYEKYTSLKKERELLLMENDEA
ncbi:MAG: DNA primase [Lactobacillaceae bacterium]|jgi:DNA primase|nr:DNA primase [Lactobacillaceae bacterium]